MLLRITEISFLLLIFSLGFMQPYQYLFGMTIPFTDLIFLITGGLWALALLFKRTRFRWHQFYWLLGAYLVAMLLSVAFSVRPAANFIKLLGGIYLCALPVLTFNLAQNETFGKRVVRTWLAASGVVALVGILTVILFYLDRDNWLLKFTLFHFGTLPPGNYPRLQATFVNANMLCNYLSVSLILGLAAEKLDWINKKLFYALFVALLFVALLTISPGLGGIGLAFGLWYWIYRRAESRFLSRASLAGGLFVAVLFIIAGSISPNAYPTAPFSVEVPFIEKRIEPSARILTWTGALNTFAAHPVFGVGVGEPVCDVAYRDLSGNDQQLSDAHNLFLSIAAKEGIPGLAAIAAICFYLFRRLFASTPGDRKYAALRIGLTIAFISAFIYQGLSGSFEDARHLWVLIGLCLVVESQEARGERREAS